MQTSDRNILILAGLALAFLAAAAVILAPPSRGASVFFPSSYSASSRGAKAAYLLLKKLGYTVERWPNPPDDLPMPSSGRRIVLVLADPFITPSAEERWRISSFVARGGRILATGTAGARLVAGASFKPKTVPWSGWTRFRARVPSSLTRNVPEIAMSTAIRWPSLARNAIECFGDRRGPTVITYARGKGSVIWWADAGPLTNFGLTQASNVMLFLKSAVGPEWRDDGSPADAGATYARHGHQTLILWDEYFHGERAGFWAYFGRTPLPWALLQLALFAAAAIVTFGRRSEPLRPLRTAGERLSPLEFVETMGALYQRKGSASGALEIAYRSFRSSLVRRLELPGVADSEAVLGAAGACYPEAAPALGGLLEQCERSLHNPALTETAALELVRELHETAGRLGIGTERMT